MKEAAASVNIPPQLVVPTNIPWTVLKQEHLEECLYWLLDSLGAKDMEWRKGGKGGGAADQGRDLEATFHLMLPDNEPDSQKWWIESKGRTGTVEPAAVKEAVINTQARKDVSVLIIATNTQFSNPTRDWVREWQANNPLPKIRLWDRGSLERLIVKHPAVAVRLFPEALSAQGRIEAIRSRFWNQCYLPSQSELDGVWLERANIAISPESALALAAGEIANGSLSIRPWMMLLSDDELKNALAVGIANAFYVLPRAEQLGTTTSPIEGALANVVMSALARLSFDDVWELTKTLWSMFDGEPPPLSVQNAALRCAVSRMQSELADACAWECKRVSCDSGIISDQDKFHYWQRFSVPSDESYQSNRRNRSSFLIMEKDDAPCDVGLDLNEKNRCPLISNDRTANVTRETLRTYSTIIRRRVEQTLT